MIGATSDLSNEVDVCRQVIANWNDINSLSTHSVILPLHWSSSVYPNVDEYPQAVIDKQIVAQSDALICLLKHRLGTPTPNYKSGVVEEIELHHNAGKDVMVFFITEDSPPFNNDQLEKLKKFKSQFGSKALFVESSIDNLPKVLSAKLTLLMHSLQAKVSLHALLDRNEPTSQQIYDAIKRYIQFKKNDYAIDSLIESDVNINFRKQHNDSCCLSPIKFSKSEISDIGNTIIKYGFNINEFTFIDSEDSEYIIFDSNHSFYIQVLKHSLNHNAFRDVSFDFYLDERVDNKEHLYLKTNSFYDIKTIIVFWLISLRDYLQLEKETL